MLMDTKTIKSCDSKTQSFHILYCALFYGNCKTLLFTCFLVTSCLAYSLTLKMEAIYSFETSVNIYQTTQHYMAIHITLFMLPSWKCCLEDSLFVLQYVRVI
jgi:hypothetical protein